MRPSWLAIILALASTHGLCQERPTVLLLANESAGSLKELRCAYEAAAQGGLRIDVMATDSRGDPAVADLAVRRALQDTRGKLLAVFGPAGPGSGPSDVAVESALRTAGGAESRIPHISFSHTPVPTQQRRAGFYFRTGTSTAVMRQAAARYLVLDRRARSVSVVWPGPRDSGSFTGDTATGYFQRICGVQDIRGSWADSVSQLDSNVLRQERAGVILPVEWLDTARELPESVRANVVAVGEHLPAPSPFQLSGLAVYTPATARALAELNPRLRSGLDAFERAYQSRCGSGAPEGRALSAYVAFQTLQAALGQTDVTRASSPAAAVAEALNRGSFNTVVGQSLQYEKGELQYERAAVRWQWERSAWRPDGSGTGGAKGKCADSTVCDQCSKCIKGSSGSACTNPDTECS